MLYLLGCRCANSEPRARTFLRENGYSKWQSIPMIKGREQCLNFLSSLPNPDKEIDMLKGYLRRTSSWSVFVGTHGDGYEWADIGHSNLKEKLDAEILIKEYKDE